MSISISASISMSVCVFVSVDIHIYVYTYIYTCICIYLYVGRTLGRPLILGYARKVRSVGSCVYMRSAGAVVKGEAPVAAIVLVCMCCLGSHS